MLAFQISVSILTSVGDLDLIIGDDVEKGPARVGAFVLASLGMAFAGIVAAIPELAQDE